MVFKSLHDNRSWSGKNVCVVWATLLTCLIIQLNAAPPRKSTDRHPPEEPWEINMGLCPPSLCPSSDSSGKRPRGTGGSVFFHGDIVLDRETELLIFGDIQSRRFKRETMKIKKKLWPDGVVPYKFSLDISQLSKRVIRQAMRHIREETCLTFRQKRTKDNDYIRFISESGCWSYVGKIGGEQKLSIGRGCEKIGTAIHEISHALGFWHEQARSDRDKYVSVMVENVSPRYLADFSKLNSSVATSRGFPYDYHSIMHYKEYTFTNTGHPTIKVKGIGKKLNYKIGQRDGLSNLDIAQLRDMYKCHEKEDEELGECPKGWKKKFRSCYKFMADIKYRYQYAAASKYCETSRSHLLSLNSHAENKFIRRYIQKKFPSIRYWRTSGKRVNGQFVWNQEDKGGIVPMKYTNWVKGDPSTYTSMALDRKSEYKWKGVWVGSLHQMPSHAYNFICERAAKRKCVPGQYKDGRDYRGMLDHTVDGVLCQKWTSQYPHPHNLIPSNTKVNSEDEIGEHNYCRNPQGMMRRRPWCFTTKSKKEWQYCDVVTCSRSAKSRSSSVSHLGNT